MQGDFESTDLVEEAGKDVGINRIQQMSLLPSQGALKQYGILSAHRQQSLLVMAA